MEDYDFILATASSMLTKAQLAESTATQQLAAKHNLARTATMSHATAANVRGLAWYDMRYAPTAAIMHWLC